MALTADIIKRPSQGRRPIDAAGPSRWLKALSLNTKRYAESIRPFRADEFGPGLVAFLEEHIRAANGLIEGLWKGLERTCRAVDSAADEAVSGPTAARLQRFMSIKEKAELLTQQVESVWDFYFDIFSQRLSSFSEQLVAADKIALECYKDFYAGLDDKKLPGPAPFTYLTSTLSPATNRRGVPLVRLLRLRNPFPLIKYPYHRMVNPWTLSAILHEVSHNIQSDVGLWQAVPLKMKRRLEQDGVPAEAVQIWVRWHKEIFADLLALLLGGPAVAVSLMDVLSRSPSRVVGFNPSGVHPTPILRVYISLELLKRMGFEEEAAKMADLWARIYPGPHPTIPAVLLKSFKKANSAVVDSIAYSPYPELGGKKLAEVVSFKEREAGLVRKAAEKLAAGTVMEDMPYRFLIGASRLALDRGLASPSAITDNFYRSIIRR